MRAFFKPLKAAPVATLQAQNIIGGLPANGGKK